LQHDLEYAAWMRQGIGEQAAFSRHLGVPGAGVGVTVMNTRKLITALATDLWVSPAPETTLLRWMVPACVLSGVALLATAGLRQDLALVAETPRVLFKWLLAGALVLSSVGALLRMARPGMNLGRWSTVLYAVGLSLAFGVIAELLLLPREQWVVQARGTNASWCLRMIPLLATAPFVAAFMMLRAAAPTKPMLAGATAGLLSGAIGASLYALHCTDDSPLFVATWYCLAILGASVAGAIVGARWLRW
jgi:hypothetical protein